MVELSFEYWNKLANQLVLISSLLGGFSVTAIANFLVSDATGRLPNTIMKVAIVSASSFMVAIFAMTSLLMLTTPGFPSEVDVSDLTLPRVIGSTAFLLGILSLIGMISLAGWTKSKHMGWFTTIIGIITLLLIIVMLIG